MSVSLKIKDYNGAGDFTLEEQQEQMLGEMLGSPSFCEQVRANAGFPEGSTVTFTGMLFQPVPWSPSTRKGMPQSLEKYQESEDYAVINVPPPFMFKAKVFSPNRLCAIYEKKAI